MLTKFQLTNFNNSNMLKRVIIEKNHEILERVIKCGVDLERCVF